MQEYEMKVRWSWAVACAIFAAAAVVWGDTKLMSAFYTFFTIITAFSAVDIE